MVCCCGVFNANATTDSLDIYITQNQDLKALKYAIKQSDYLLKHKLYKEWCKINIRKSKIYVKLNDSPKATNLLYATLKVAEKHKLEFEKVLIYNEVAKNFQLTLNSVQSNVYFKKGEKIAIALKNDTLKAFMQQGLFANAIHTKDKGQAFYYMKSIMKVHKNKGNFDQIHRCYSNYSNYYFVFHRENTELGKKYLDSALYYAEKNNKLKYLTASYSNLAYYYMTTTKEFKKAEQELLKVLALKPNDTTSSQVSDIYLNLSYAYEQLNDFKTANKYMMKYIENTTNLFQNKINSKLRDAENRYQIDKVEQEYKKQQADLIEKQSKRQKIFLVIIAVIIVLSILLYFFLQNIRLKEKNKLKDIQSQVQQNIINATIDGQEIERKKIASVLHDSISAQLSSAGLHLSAYSAMTKNDSQEITKTRAILKEAHDKVRDLSHELLPVLLAKFGLLYALQDLCEKNSNSLIQFEYSSDMSTFKRFHDEYEMKVYFIITELLNNILKHSEATEAELIINENNGFLDITVKDNGKGFKTTKGSDDGFGLTQIRARILNMKGTFNVTSKPNQGATIYINIPIQE